MIIAGSGLLFRFTIKKFMFGQERTLALINTSKFLFSAYFWLFFLLLFYSLHHQFWIRKTSRFPDVHHGWSKMWWCELSVAEVLNVCFSPFQFIEFREIFAKHLTGVFFVLFVVRSLICNKVLCYEKRERGQY
jgi:hypothetical protein